jgi:hypothetical protein
VDGQNVTYNKVDFWAGLWPYNVQVAPGGLIALTADNGNSGSSDGNVDTVSVIDMSAPQPHVIDKVVVGDAPEGLAISPTGKVAVAILLNGSNSAKSAFFYHRNGVVAVLRIDGKKVSVGRGRGAGPARGRRVQPRREVALRRQLPRRRRLHPQGGRHEDHRHRQAARAARPSGLDAGTHVLSRLLVPEPR